jgi:hypothetical protein
MQRLVHANALSRPNALVVTSLQTPLLGHHPGIHHWLTSCNTFGVVGSGAHGDCERMRQHAFWECAITQAVHTQVLNKSQECLGFPGFGLGKARARVQHTIAWPGHWARWRGLNTHAVRAMGLDLPGPPGSPGNIARVEVPW